MKIIAAGLLFAFSSSASQLVRHFLGGPMKPMYMISIILSLAFVSPAVGERQKTLREKVDEQGSISIGSSGDYEEEMDVSKLVAKSKLVVTCRIAGVKTRVSNDETGIWTDFTATLLEVLHNATANDDPKTVTVSLVGGKIKFPKGTAEVNAGNYPHKSHPILGQYFILFLETSQEDSSKYQPVSGPQGVFRVANEKIIPAVSEEHPLFEKLGKDRSAFIEEIKTAKGGQK